MSEDKKKIAPDAQSLVGASEAAEIMDVELSTFSHLRRREEKNGGSRFPTPVATLRCGPIWKTSDIKRFAAKYTPPRPGPKPGTVAKLPVKKAPAKIVGKPVGKTTKKAAAGNGEAIPSEEAAPRKRSPRKVVASKKVPASV